MTEKQKRFADEYLIDCNATRAYKAAYPHITNDASACTMGGRLLGNVEVQAYIKVQRDLLHSERIASAEETLEYLTAVVRGEALSEVIVTEGKGAGISQARKVTRHPDQRERLKAAELLAKHHQLLVPKVQLEAEKGGGIIILSEVTDGDP